MTDANDEPAATEPDKPNQTPPTPAGSPEDFSLRGSPPLVTRLSRKAMAVIGIVAGVGIGGSLIYALQQRQPVARSEEHTSELQSLMRISYAVFCLKKQKVIKNEYRVHNI